MLKNAEGKIMKYKNRIYLIPTATLREHEEINPLDYYYIRKLLIETQELNYPILVDVRSNTVLDGHHRLRVLKELCFNYIPVYYVDYLDSEILVFSRRNDIKINKFSVLMAAIKGVKYPPKTTKHVMVGRSLPKLCINLNELRQPERTHIPIIKCIDWTISSTTELLTMLKRCYHLLMSIYN